MRSIMRMVFGALMLLVIGTLLAFSARIYNLFPRSGQVVYEDYKCQDCNVVLITIDTLRADHLGTYGHYRNISPAIDRFAERGVLFEHAFSQAPRTTESHMSMMTSLYPVEHGVVMFSREYQLAVSSEEIRWRPLDENIPTLAEILQSYNYSTRAYTGGGGVHGDYGFKRGFEEYLNDFDMMQFATLDNPFGIVKKLANGNKFFLFLHTYKTHWPYLPRQDNRESLCGLSVPHADIERRFIERILSFMVEHPDSYTSERFADYLMDFFDGRVDLPKIPDTPPYRQMVSDIKTSMGSGYSSRMMEEITRRLRETMNSELLFIVLADYVMMEEQFHLWSEELAEYFSCLYGAEILEMDQVIAKLMDNLEEEGLSDNTLIIFVSDHGEEFFEHGGYDHRYLYKEILHVPLIMRNPVQLGGGLRVASPVSLVDLAPTLLDILDIPPPYGFRGRSLVPAMLGESFPAKPAFSDRRDVSDGLSGFEGLEQDYSVVDWPYHLIWGNPASIQLMGQYSGRQDCYEQILQEGNLLFFNLKYDPLEQKPLLESESKESMVRLICTHIGDAYDFHATSPSMTSSPFPEELQEQLRALGYLG